MKRRLCQARGSTPEKAVSVKPTKKHALRNTVEDEEEEVKKELNAKRFHIPGWKVQKLAVESCTFTEML